MIFFKYVFNIISESGAHNIIFIQVINHYKLRKAKYLLKTAICYLHVLQITGDIATLYFMFIGELPHLCQNTVVEISLFKM